MSASADFAVPDRALRRYILANEKIIIATHRHWAMLWEPILTTAGAFFFALSILVAVDPGVRDDMGWVWLPFVVLGARLLYKWLEWRARWFVMTDRRLLLLDGFLVHRVAMMPSEKVTDLSYERTPLGQILGYGTFILETAGQDQALDRVTWVPRPDSRYRLIIAALFHPDAADAEAAAQANPEIRPQAAPPTESPAVAPPALMPRIGRRSNPPTQRIAVPLVRDDAGAGGTAAGTTGSGAAWDGPGSSTRGGPTHDGTATDRTVADGAGQGSAVRDGQDASGAPWPRTGGAAAPAASGGGTHAGRAHDGRHGQHVPGGPTADPHAAEVRPEPFLEGGKDPKIR